MELDRPITEIAVGAQQRVEILKTLYRGAELLILDEPTAALTDIEVEGLFQICLLYTSGSPKNHHFQLPLRSSCRHHRGNNTSSTETR